MIRTSETIAELSKALVSAQKEMVNPKKNKANSFYNSEYAELDEVIRVSKLPLANNGLSVIQMPSQSQDWVDVETMLLHESGEFIAETLSMPLPKGSKNQSQEVGKCITYARRYALASVCGIAQEDDDGNFAEQSEPKALPVKKSTKKQQEQQDILQDYVNKIKSLVSTDDVAGTKELIGELTDEEKLGIRPKLSENEVEYLSKYSDKNKGEIR